MEANSASFSFCSFLLVTSHMKIVGKTQRKPQPSRISFLFFVLERCKKGQINKHFHVRFKGKLKIKPD